VPDSAGAPYDVEHMEFGREYIIPKPSIPRVLIWEQRRGQAAMETGVAQLPVDLADYREQLERRLGKAHEFMRVMVHRRRCIPSAWSFPRATRTRILRACQILIDEKMASLFCWAMSEDPAQEEELRLNLKGVEIINPATSPWKERFIEESFQLRQAEGHDHRSRPSAR